MARANWLRRQLRTPAGRAIGAWVITFVLAALMFTHVQDLYRIASIRASVGEVRSALIDIETEQRGYLLAGGPASKNSAVYLDPYRLARMHLTLRMAALCGKIPHTPTNVQLCAELARLVKQKLEEMELTVRLAEQGHLDRATAIFATNDGERLKVAILKTLDQIRLAQDRGNLPQRAASCLVP